MLSVNRSRPQEAQTLERFLRDSFDGLSSLLDSKVEPAHRLLVQRVRQQREHVPDLRVRAERGTSHQRSGLIRREEAEVVRREATHLWTMGPIGASFGVPMNVRGVVALWPSLVPREAVRAESRLVEVKV